MKEREQNVSFNCTRKNVKYYICVAISLCFIFLFGKLVQPFAGITPVGISILGIFFGVLIATIVTGETFWPALLGLFGMIVCDFDHCGRPAEDLVRQYHHSADHLGHGADRGRDGIRARSTCWPARSSRSGR